MTSRPLLAHPIQEVADFAAAGKPFALLLVLRDAGSTPRKAGTRAIVDAAGNIRGTIGGGLLESDARRMAVESIGTGRPTVFDFPFSGESARGDDPVCGGKMRVLVDPTAIAHLPAYAAAAEALRSRRRGVLATLVRASGTKVVVRWCAADDDRRNQAFSDLLQRNEPRYLETVRAGATRKAEILFEPVVPAPLLLIAGGGHVAQALAWQARRLWWPVAVVDDRPEFADPSLYPPDVEVCRGRFAELASRRPLNRDTYVAVVGRGHKVDADALAAVIDQPVGYVGMMGSRRKIALMRRDFLESKLATAEQFDRVHAPIGLDIGAETVEEIAASIVAELVAVRRGRRAPG